MKDVQATLEQPKKVEANPETPADVPTEASVADQKVDEKKS